MKPMTPIRLIVLSALIAGLAFVAPASAKGTTEMQITVVNPAVLVQKAPQASARERLKEKFASRRQKLKDLQQEIMSKAQKLSKNAAAMSADELDAKKEDLQAKKLRFRQMKQNYNQDVQKSERQEFNKLRKSIQKVIVQVARENGYDLVLSNGIVYANDAVDITDEVLQALNARAHSGN